MLTESKTKIQIVEELIIQGHISLKQGLILLETEKEYIYVPSNTPPDWYKPNPLYPPYNPIIYGTTNPRDLHNIKGRTETFSLNVTPEAGP